VAEVAAAAATDAEEVRSVLLAAVLDNVLRSAVELQHLKPAQRGALRNAIAVAAPSVLNLASRCLPEPAQVC
jgi:hypothetical protein